MLLAYTVAGMPSARAAGDPALGNTQSGGGNDQDPREISRWSPSTSSGAPNTVADSNAATRGSALNDTPRRPATVEENRQQALDILEGGARVPDDGRAAESLISRATEDPISAGQASTSGREAKVRRAAKRT
ncbi:hypothetical protein BJY01DRAFT_219917 [Aspergillus pseudoustus]|uniref:SMP domain-containing protein n=1 Tax=Aspergillus pseudoustus TaxID=1810923 RepID=A0ABR4JHV7_9EURO